MKLVSIMLMLCGLAACATSPGFKFGVQPSANTVATREIAYATADTINPSAPQFVTDAQALQSAVATQGNITLSTFVPAWNKVYPQYSSYVSADQKLSVDDAKSALTTVTKVNHEIDLETNRPNAFWTGLFSPSTQPSK